MERKLLGCRREISVYVNSVLKIERHYLKSVNFCCVWRLINVFLKIPRVVYGVFPGL